MRESEIEIVRYPQLKGLSIFFDTVSYRTPHVHRELELLWILEGQMEIGGIRPPREASRGELFLFNPGQIHECDGKGQKCTFLCFQISKELLSALPLIDRVRFDEAALSAPPEGAGDDLTAEQWHKHIQKVKEYLARAALEYLEMSPGYELGCSGQMQLAFRELLRLPLWHRESQEEETDRAVRQERVEKIINYVDRNYMHKIRLSDLADEEGLSMGYLSHFVKDTLGMSFQDYVSQVRFNSARKLIEGGGMKMLDVCYASGYSDYRYFSQTFVKRLGMTPEAYSRSPQPRESEQTRIHQSVHSLEQFYTRSRSMQMLEELVGGYLE